MSFVVRQVKEILLLQKSGDHDREMRFDSLILNIFPNIAIFKREGGEKKGGR